MSWRTTFVVAAAGLSLAMVSTEALAEDPPPPTPSTTDPAPTGSASASATASTSTPPVAAAQTTTATATAKVDDGTPDHERVIGHLGVTYFNVTQIPIANDNPAALVRQTVSAPVVGVRYWLNRQLGIDVGLGFGFQSASTETVNGGTTVNTDLPSALGLAIHGGVPLAFAHGKHYSFLAIPELTVAFASGTTKPPGNAPDIDRSGFKLDIGGRIGAEIYFGFIGVPELALNASVGLFFQREAWKVAAGNVSASQGTTGFGTSVQADPWAIFTNNISAIYYF